VSDICDVLTPEALKISEVGVRTPWRRQTLESFQKKIQTNQIKIAAICTYLDVYDTSTSLSTGQA